MTQRYAFLGASVDALTADALLEHIAMLIAAGEPSLLPNHNLHSLALLQDDDTMRRFYARARCVHVDGMAIVLLARLLGHPLRREHRVSYADFVHPLLARAAASGWRVAYVGGRAEVVARGAARCRARHPGLQLEAIDGFFDPAPASAGNAAVVARVATFRPDLLLVGMGMPRQERWLLENFDHLQATVALTVGACMDYVAGAVPTPPRWAGRVGLEWAFRLVSEPGRLWRRYLMEPWELVGPVLQELRRGPQRPATHDDGRTHAR